jgi:arginyl-tRNA synthetase
VVYLTPQTLLKFGFDLTDEEKQQKRLPFSSRKGWVVTLDDTFDLLKSKAFKETKKRNPDKDNDWLDDTAEKIAL